MIDQKLLLNEFESTARRLQRKGVDSNSITELRQLLLQSRTVRQAVEERRASINKASEEVGVLARDAHNTDKVTQLRQAVTDLKNELVGREEELEKLEEQIEYILLRIPNLPADDCPDGSTEKDNVVRRTWGYQKDAYIGRSYRAHWDVATELGIYDAERAAKISGSMFALLRGEGAALLRALVKFGIDLNAAKYEEILPPHFVRTETFTATGHLPKFEVEAYKLRDDDLWAIPTGEVPLMSIHRDETIPIEQLPKCYMAYTVCFRREAGSAGKDTRGMQRLHEFHKVELLKLCTPDQVATEFESMLADAERPLQLLGLPYRVVDLCAGDLTFSSARIYDLEVYAPGVDKWLEVSSVGIFTDFQARRGNIRFKAKNARPQFVHALNGSAMATPRVWAAIIEHGQQADGSVKIPDVLVPYMGAEYIRKK